MLPNSVKCQAAVALEKMYLAEQIAGRMELDRRAEREMQIARDVQSRLFPQTMPALAGQSYFSAVEQGRNEVGAEVLLTISRELRESPEEYAATVATRPASSQCRTNTISVVQCF